MMNRNTSVVGAVLFLLTWPVAGAEPEPDEPTIILAASTEDLFGRGRYELSFNNGVLFSPFLADKNRPVIDYTLSEVQFGYMLSPVKGRSWWRGNFEVAGEGFGSAIVEGPGSYIAGATVWLRYNFVPRASRWVPFVQAGAGLTGTDIDRGIVGQTFQFNLDIGIGARYLLSERWALAAEYRYQHISNADTGVHNLGINAHGPMLGISYLF